MRVEFLLPSSEEYKEAVEYYNLQSKDLGKKFSFEVSRTISLINLYPESFSKYIGDTRRAVVSSFPYNIIYSIEGNLILIIGMAHQHRKPYYWVNR